MFKTEDIVGDVIIISLNDSERYSAVGIKTEGSHFLVKGYDHIGIWVEHPGLAEKTAQVDHRIKRIVIVTNDHIRMPCGIERKFKRTHPM